MCFNVNKCHIVKVGAKNKKFDYEMNSIKIESTQWVKDLGVAIAFNLKFSQQCKNAAGKTYRIDKDTIISIHNSSFRSCLEFDMQSWYPVPPPNKGHGKTSSPVKDHEDDFIPV